MTRILHVSQPVSEGVARWVAALAADQVARGWSVTVACPPEGWLGGEIMSAGAALQGWAARRSPGPAVGNEALDLRGIVTAVCPDVVHLHSSKAGLAGRLALRGGVPTLFQPHCWSFHATGGPVALATRAWERAGSRWSTRIICVSEAERDEGIAVGIAPDRIAVVRNGIDPRIWPAADQSVRLEARVRLRLDPSAPLAVCVGRLSRQKGQDLLLSAWPQVLARVPDATLRLVGDGPARASLEATAAGMQGVALVGSSGDVAGWLAAADVVVLPSRWEGLALTALEAAATARSLVATDVAGMAEVIGTGPGAGGAVIATGPTLAGDLADAVANRLTRREIADAEGAAARRRVERGFLLRDALDRTARLAAALSRPPAAAPTQPAPIPPPPATTTTHTEVTQ